MTVRKTINCEIHRYIFLCYQSKAFESNSI